MASWKGRDGGRASYHKVPNDDMLEQENDRMVSTLASKISSLKNIAIDIDNEAKYQNKYVGEMTDDFDSAGGFLGSSMNRLNTMIASSTGNRKMMCYLILFLVCGFFLCWYLVGRFRS
ncbi:BET1-like protein [Hydractinia symbiolongicarpus]|uniref:BET1-like protein n=1 Tax=Hydractinia symbiolongicarpus TaxID=13093 RepID=UPI002549E268|nr:BET1-like protein [Hydractinia symbiolongicarpus]